jgi:hypothetical protein
LLPSAPITAVSRPCELGRFCKITAPAPSPNRTRTYCDPANPRWKKLFRTDDQHGVVGAGHDELLADFEAVNEPGTSRFQIERRRALGPDLFLHQTGGRGKHHVRRDGGDDDEINLLAVTPAAFMARMAALAARSEVNSSLAAMRRSLIPVREVIHSSVVSTIFSSSKLVSALAGTYAPTPAIETRAALEIMLGAGVFEFGFG